jgi:hypothetical protein
MVKRKNYNEIAKKIKKKKRRATSVDLYQNIICRSKRFE